MRIGKFLSYICRVNSNINKYPFCMKKLYSFFQILCALALVLLVANNTFAQIVVTDDNPYNEGFEGVGLNNWTTEAIMGNDVWGDIYTEHHTGSKCVNYSSSLFGDFMNMDFENLDILELFEVLGDMQNIGNGSARIVSPVLDLSGMSGATLKFYRRQTSMMIPQVLSVYYRTSTSGQWILLQQYSNTTDWTEETLNLPTLSATYQIAFQGLFNAENATADLDIMDLMMGGDNMDFSSNIYLDDIYVGSGSGGSSSSCDAPQNLTINYITHNSATANWTSTATNWTLEIGPAGFTHGNGATYTAQNPLYTFTNLSPNTSYDVYVRANCTGGATSSWVQASFTTTNSTGIGENELSCLTVFPNPTTGIVRCTVNSDLTNARLQVLDVYGKLLMEQPVTEATTYLDLSNRASGVYFLRVVSDNQVVTTQKIVRR